MTRTDNDELRGLEALSRMIGSGKSDPESNFYNEILTKRRGGTTQSNAAKGIAGFMAARRNSNINNQAQTAMFQDQLRKMQRNYDAANILQQHEKEGLGENVTFKTMMQRYAQTGDDFYKNIAMQFKKGSRNTDPITMKKNYIVSKYGSIDNMDDVSRQNMTKDPVIQHFDQQINKYLGVNPEAAPAPGPSQIEPNATDETTGKEGDPGQGGLSGLFNSFFGKKGRSMPEAQAAGPSEPITQGNIIATAVKNLGGRPKGQVVNILQNQIKAKRITQKQAEQIYDGIYGDSK